MSKDQNVSSIDAEDGDLPNEGRIRDSLLRSREDVDKNRKDLLMHILNRTGDFQNSEDEEKEGSKVINPFGKLVVFCTTIDCFSFWTSQFALYIWA